jgi:dolichol-phosphate mannosyltransferase
MMGMTCGDERLVSVVIPACNEAACLGPLYVALREACEALPYRFEFLFIDDGSTDETVAVLAELRNGDDRVRYLSLSRNFGQQAALSAGLDHAAGEAVIMLDADLQHPPALFSELLVRWEAGYDVVNTIRITTAGISPGKQACSRLFYRVFNAVSGMRIAAGSADFRLISRRVAEVLCRLPEHRRFFRGLVPWLGFRQTEVRFHAPARPAGRTKYGFLSNLAFALDGMTSFGGAPLRSLAWIGGLIAGASGAIAASALLAVCLGWGKISLEAGVLWGVLFFGGCQLLTAGVLGEYLVRILEQVRGRPLYLVREAAGLTPMAENAANAGLREHERKERIAA